MIVLDEQLLGSELKLAIQKWYQGTVTDITQLRPGTVIKDDTIPLLLRTVPYPTFVTINVTDFWRRVRPDPNFMLACFAFPQSQAHEIPAILQRLFQAAPFRTRKERMGKIAHVSRLQVRYYTTETWAIQTLAWSASGRQRKKK